MTVPTWNRTLAEFVAPFALGRCGATALGLELLEHSLVELPDQYLACLPVDPATRRAFADSVTAFLRAFTEPSLIETPRP